MKQYIYGKNPIMEALKGASVYKIYMLNGHKDQKIFDLCKRNQIPLEFVDKKEFDKKVGKVAFFIQKRLEKLQKLCKIRLEKLQNKQKRGWKK